MEGRKSHQFWKLRPYLGLSSGSWNLRADSTTTWGKQERERYSAVLSPSLPSTTPSVPCLCLPLALVGIEACREGWGQTEPGLEILIPSQWIHVAVAGLLFDLSSHLLQKRNRELFLFEISFRIQSGVLFCFCFFFLNSVLVSIFFLIFLKTEL